MLDAISIHLLSNREKISLYAKINRSYLNMEAVFSDETENYVMPTVPEQGQLVTIKLRCQKDNIDGAFLYASEIFPPGKPAALDEAVTDLPTVQEEQVCVRQYEMKKHDSQGFFDYYSVSLRAEAKVKYYFILKKQDRVYYYNKRGLYGDLDTNYNFTLIPGFKTPDWAKGAVMYQIYVDRFYNGSKENDVLDNEYTYLGKAAKRIEDWSRPVAKEDICNFYGGDLQGVVEKMGYLKNLGVEVIYLNPIFVSPSNHKYDIQDYDYVDPHLAVIVKDGGKPLYFEKFHNRFATAYMQRTTGKENLEASNQFLAKMIALAHENGLKVILDGVFNHCGAFNKWMDREGFYQSSGYPAGAYRDEASIYHDYFRWYDKNWPHNDCYDSWWGFDNHPKLNYETSPKLYQYIMDIGKKWVSPPFNADGWRLDVAADLGYSPSFNHQFWQDFRTAVKEANPDAIILAEHYGDASPWLEGDQWDTVMNYDAFMEPITWFLTGMEKHSEEFKSDMLCNAMAFENAMRYFMSRFSIQSLQTAMNQLSNHDHSRFLTRTNMKTGRLHTVGATEAETGINKGIMKEAVTFQMTWPGAPSVYYGDEAGLAGWTDPDNRRTYPWGREDKELLDFHKAMIALHKQYKALKTGSLEYLTTDYGILSYGRWDREDQIAVILNNNRDERRLQIPVWKMETGLSGTMERLMYTDVNRFSKDKAVYPIQDGHIKLNMPAYSSMVLRKRTVLL